MKLIVFFSSWNLCKTRPIVVFVESCSLLHNLHIDQVDPTSGEAEDDGVEDEYQLEDLEVVAADYILKVGVSNFRNAWESMDPDSERVDEYGLGPREGLSEAVNTVITLLGMQPCEVSQWCQLWLRKCLLLWDPFY